MKRYTIIVLFSLSMMLVFIFAYNIFSLLTEKQSKELIVGTNIGYGPFIFTSKQGEIIGFDKQLIEIVAKKIGKTVTVKSMRFSALQTALQNKKVDMIIGGLTITDQRLQKMLMIPYLDYGAKELSLIFWNTLPIHLHGIVDLLEHYPQTLVATQAQTTMHDYLIELGDRITIKICDYPDELISELSSRRCQALLLEKMTADFFAHKYPEIKTVTFVVSNNYEYSSFGIGIRKDNKILHSKICNALTALKKDGTLKELRAKWFN